MEPRFGPSRCCISAAKKTKLDTRILQLTKQPHSRGIVHSNPKKGITWDCRQLQAVLYRGLPRMERQAVRKSLERERTQLGR